MVNETNDDVLTALVHVIGDKATGLSTEGCVRGAPPTDGSYGPKTLCHYATKRPCGPAENLEYQRIRLDLSQG
jgi:hypothetical protein